MPWSFTDGTDPCWDRPHPYPVALDAGSHHLRIEAMCGRLASVSRPGGRDRFVVDIGRLYGREIELGSFTPDDLLVQDSLF